VATAQWFVLDSPDDETFRAVSEMRNRCRILTIIERSHRRQFEAAVVDLGMERRCRTRHLAGGRPRKDHERALGAAHAQWENGGA
jgi:hypothetical protein